MASGLSATRGLVLHDLLWEKEPNLAEATEDCI